MKVGLRNAVVVQECADFAAEWTRLKLVQRKLRQAEIVRCVVVLHRNHPLRLLSLSHLLSVVLLVSKVAYTQDNTTGADVQQLVALLLRCCWPCIAAAARIAH